MASLIDVFGRLLLDDEGRGFVASAAKAGEQAGDQAGKSMGQRVSAGLKAGIGTGARVLAGAAAATLGVMTKGALELQEVTARYRAETGATAEEAERASKVINRVAGTERLALEAVADAAIAVRRDLGATGEEADALTATFSRFARVTKQEPAAAVAAFDDILDAWGLTAADAQGLMDKLVVSGQQFGGTIEADEAALASMAPQLRALNLEVDDGIALLNLFKASGLDAAGIPRALNSAIQNLDGQPLEAFVAELAGIEDPAKRAERAIEVFGSRAGAQLANAIQPGMTSLDAFRITTEEATGATEEAAEALDSTFGAKAQRFISESAAKLREWGAAFGPGLTGLASLASLGGALGLDRVVAGLLGPLAAKMRDAGKAAGGALIEGIGTATGAAGTVIGNFIASRIEAVIGPNATVMGTITRKSATAMGKLWGIVFAGATALGRLLAGVIDLLPGGAAVRGALVRAGGKMGLMLAGAMFVGSAWATMLGGALSALPGAGAIKGAASSVGGLLGRSLGGFAAAAFAAFMIFQVVETYNRIKAEIGAQLEQINKDASAQLVSGTDEALAMQKAALEKGIEELNATWDFGIFTNEARDKLTAELDATNAEIERRALGLGPAVQDSLEAGAGPVEEGAAAMMEGVPEAIGNVVQAIPGIMRDLPGQVADGIRSGRSSITSAVAQLREDLKNALNPAKEEAELVGLLTSKALARGLKSNDPLVVAQAEYTRNLIEERLAELIVAGGPLGKAAMRELQQGLHSKDPDVRRQAQHTRDLVQAKLDSINGEKTGHVAGGDLAEGLRDKTGAVGAAGRALAAAAVIAMIGRVAAAAGQAAAAIAGLLSSGQVPGFAEGGHTTAGSVQWVGERGRELWVPDVAGTVIPESDIPQGDGPGGGDSYSTTIMLPERPRSNLEVLERVSWYQRQGLINPRPRRLSRSGAS